MITYIYLIMEDLAIRCVNGINCIPISNAHFTYLLSSVGLLELVFEIPLVLRIFKSREKTEENAPIEEDEKIK